MFEREMLNGKMETIENVYKSEEKRRAEEEAERPDFFVLIVLKHLLLPGSCS
jgi:hypothetical protein